MKLPARMHRKRTRGHANCYEIDVCMTLCCYPEVRLLDWSQGYKKFMLNSAEHEILNATSQFKSGVRNLPHKPINYLSMDERKFNII